MQNRVKENYTISGYFVFFLIAVSQKTGIVSNFQSLVLRDAGQDAWISVMLLGLSLHLIIWMVYKMLGYPAKDVIDLHRTIFGNFMGNSLSLLLVGYFFIISLFVFRTYIEIIQVWVFPTIQTWALAAIFICMIYYFVSGGFRLITGLCFFGFLIPSSLIFFLYFPIRQGDLQNLMPVLNHSFLDLLKASKSSSLFTSELKHCLFTSLS